TLRFSREYPNLQVFRLLEGDFQFIRDRLRQRISRDWNVPDEKAVCINKEQVARFCSDADQQASFLNLRIAVRKGVELRHARRIDQMGLHSDRREPIAKR